MKSLSRVRLCDPMDSSRHQAPVSMGFSRQEYWSGLPFPSPGNLPNPGIEPRSLTLYYGCHIMSLLIFLGGNWKQIKNVLKYWSVLRWKSESEVAQSCLSLCDPMDYNLPGFSVHGIFQARVLEWVAISVSKGSSLPRD